MSDSISDGSIDGGATTCRTASPNWPREGEVALVVRGHGHDRAGAVAEQHVVGDPDRDALAVDRVDGVRAQRHAGLLAVGRESVDLRLAARLESVGVDASFCDGVGQLLDQRVLRRQDHERGAEQRVRPRGEDTDLLAAD